MEIVTNIKEETFDSIENKNDSLEMKITDVYSIKEEEIETVEVEQLKIEESKPESSFIDCVYCPFRSHKAVDVQVHLEETHICNVCHSIFVYKENRDKHMKIHSDTKNFEIWCSYCKKGFHDKSSLGKHILSEHKHINADEHRKNVPRKEIIPLDEILNKLAPQQNVQTVKKPIVKKSQMLPSLSVLKRRPERRPPCYNYYPDREESKRLKRLFLDDDADKAKYYYVNSDKSPSLLKVSSEPSVSKKLVLNKMKNLSLPKKKSYSPYEQLQASRRKENKLMSKLLSTMRAAEVQAYKKVPDLIDMLDNLMKDVESCQNSDDVSSVHTETSVISTNLGCQENDTKIVCEEFASFTSNLCDKDRAVSSLVIEKNDISNADDSKDDIRENTELGSTLNNLDSVEDDLKRKDELASPSKIKCESVQGSLSTTVNDEVMNDNLDLRPKGIKQQLVTDKVNREKPSTVGKKISSKPIKETWIVSDKARLSIKSDKDMAYKVIEELSVGKRRRNSKSESLCKKKVKVSHSDTKEVDHDQTCDIFVKKSKGPSDDAPKELNPPKNQPNSRINKKKGSVDSVARQNKKKMYADPKLSKIPDENPYSKKAQSFRKKKVSAAAPSFDLEREVERNLNISTYEPYCSVCEVLLEPGTESVNSGASISGRIPEQSVVWIPRNSTENPLESFSTSKLLVCSSCKVCVHEACYDVTTNVKKEVWKCDRCVHALDDPERTASCCLCSGNQGALKRSRGDQFFHIKCAVLIPELTGSTEFDMNRIPRRRWNVGCLLCGETGKEPAVHCMGSKKCMLSFHLSCAFANNVDCALGPENKVIFRCSFCVEAFSLRPEQHADDRFGPQDIFVGETVEIANHPGVKTGTVVAVEKEEVYSVAFDDGTFCDSVEPDSVTFCDPEHDNDLDAESCINAPVKIIWEGEECSGIFKKKNTLIWYKVKPTKKSALLELERSDLKKKQSPDDEN